MTFEPALNKLSIIEAAELGGQTSKRPNQVELSRYSIDDETKPSPLRKLEAIHGFPMCLGQWLSCGEQIGVQMEAAISSKGEVADPVGSIKGSKYQVSGRADMLGPRNHEVCKRQIRTGL